MRRVLILLIYFLSNKQTAFLQNVSISIDWPPSDFAYVGAENSLSCTVEGISCKYVILSTDNGTMIKDRCNYYIFKPNHVADSKITVSKKVRKRSRKIGEFFIRVRTIPDPVAVVGGLHGGSISKGALRAQTGIGAGSPPYLSIDIHYSVKSFSITIIRNRELFFFKSCDGNLFNDEIQNAFKQLQTDDIVIFSSIMVQLPDEGQTLAMPFELKIE
ncbi:MAG: GldM family protein [Chitinophagaceae bacterium]